MSTAAPPAETDAAAPPADGAALALDRLRRSIGLAIGEVAVSSCRSVVANAWAERLGGEFADVLIEVDRLRTAARPPGPETLDRLEAHRLHAMSVLRKLDPISPEAGSVRAMMRMARVIAGVPVDVPTAIRDARGGAVLSTPTTSGAMPDGLRAD